MTQQGKVISLEDGFVHVQIRQKTACEGCHQKAECGECASFISIKAENACDAREGDVVEIYTATARVLFYSVAVFLLPLILAFAGYFLGELLFHRQLFSILFSLLMLVLSFVLLRFTLDRHAQGSCMHRAVCIVKQPLEE